MKKHHKVFLGSYGTIILIFMIVTAITLNGIVLKQKANNKALKEKIETLENDQNAKLNEIATTLINTKESLNQDITTTAKELGKIKATDYKDFSGIINISLDSVVFIQTLSKQGAGFFIDKEGHIATNEHVLKDENGELLKLIQVYTNNNKVYAATYIGSIESLDLALIKINTESKPLEFIESKNIQIGEEVIAIGSPQGLAFTVTNGIVSQTKRIGFNGVEGYIQTNAELNEGNSGGPLINKEGKVIGINNFKVLGAEGLGFALESDIAVEGINKITETIYNQSIFNNN